jgi:GxxExxY protein
LEAWLAAAENGHVCGQAYQVCINHAIIHRLLAFDFVSGMVNRRGAEGAEKIVMDGLTEKIIGAAIDVHKVLGPGLLESAYELCLAHEFSLANISFERQVPLPLTYKSLALDCGNRLDFLVEKIRMVVVELKAVEGLQPIYEAQLLTYLKLGGWPIGLLINFNVPVLKKGIKRMMHNLKKPLGELGLSTVNKHGGIAPQRR